MSSLLADFEREREAITKLLQPDCQERILLFSGESGIGKTQLLKFCLGKIQDPKRKIQIDLKGGIHGITEIFSRSALDLKWDRENLFIRTVTNPQPEPRIQVNENSLAGINNSISVYLNVDRLADREQRRSELTEAWFGELAALRYPILIVMDTFEQATTEVKNWIGGPFLARVARLEQLRVVIAGQQVPDANSIEWGHCCASYSLSGVPDARHWLPVVQAMQRRVPFADPLSALGGICAALKGRPNAIMQFLETLPLAEL